MVKLDKEKLQQFAPNDLEPMDLNDPADIKHGDQIYIVQHPNLRPTEFSSSPCTTLGE